VFRIKHNQIDLSIDFDDADICYDVVDFDYGQTTVLAVNIQGTLNHLHTVRDLIKKYWPMFVWIMEPYNGNFEIQNYVKIQTLDFYKNQLWIREDYYQGRNISRIDYGVQVDDLNFRYLPPHTKKFKLEENEIGDFNFRTNKWIKMNVKCENRFGIPGGMCVQTSYANQTNFFKFPSDHDAMYIRLAKQMKKQRDIDWIKMEYQLKPKENDTGEAVTNIYKTRLPRNKTIKNIRINSKIINPITKHLSLDDWKDLYQHNIQKLSNVNYIPKLNEQEIKQIQSKAKDVNDIQIYKFLNMMKKYNKAERQLILKKLCKMRFDTRTVCLKKKGKPPDKVKNLRPIQISPISFKLAEQSRQMLKLWLERNIDENFHAFVPNKSIFTMLDTIMKSKIVKKYSN
jgi:hypothetical protein